MDRQAASQKRDELKNVIETQKSRIRELEHAEESLKHWKDREPRIMHYLGIFKDIME